MSYRSNKAKTRIEIISNAFLAAMILNQFSQVREEKLETLSSEDQKD